MSRRKSVNEHVFDVVDTPEKAYWLGFLLADGCVTAHNGTPVISLGLGSKDAEHVERFRAFVRSEKKLDRSVGCKLAFRSPHMAARLKELGIEPRKSCRERAVAELIDNRDFWRGVVDGDGWVKYRRNGWGEIGLCGSEVLCEQFLSYVRTVTATSARVRKAGQANNWLCRVTGYNGVDVMRRLYAGCSVALERKVSEARAAIAAFDQRGHRKGKLTDEQVRQIRSKYRPRVYSYARLAAENGVSELVIERIIKGRAYRRVL